LTLPPPLLAAGALCAGIGMAPVFPVTIAAVARACSPRIASALIATAALGGATVPWLVGAVSAATGSLALGLATLLVLLMLLAAGHAMRVRAGFEVPAGPEPRT
jgi:fucose permease